MEFFFWWKTSWKLEQGEGMMLAKVHKNNSIRLARTTCWLYLQDILRQTVNALQDIEFYLKVK